VEELISAAEALRRCEELKARLEELAAADDAEAYAEFAARCAFCPAPSSVCAARFHAPP
jgi:hypothetical protein